MDGNNMNYNNQPVPVSDSGKGFGVTAMVLGIIALVSAVMGCCFAPLFVLSAILVVLSIIFGIVAIAKKSGKSMGIAGIACSGATLLIGIIYVVIVFVFAIELFAMPFMMYGDDYYDNDDYYDYDYDDYYDYDYDF